MPKHSNTAIHYLNGDKTVCGLPLSREMVFTYNLRRCTCLNCKRTLAYIRAFAGLKRHVTSSGKFVQLQLFKVGK